jgi:hypothetical protein
MPDTLTEKNKMQKFFQFVNFLTEETISEIAGEDYTREMALAKAQQKANLLEIPIYVRECTVTLINFDSPCLFIPSAPIMDGTLF